MLRAALSVILSTFFLAAPSTARTEDSPVLTRITEKGEIRVGMSASQPPFNTKNRDGDVIGLDRDLAALLADAIGVKLRIVERPFPELLGALQGGEVDMVMSGMTITLERNMKVAFVGPYIVSGKSILTNSEALARAKSAEDINLANLKLAALENSTSQKFIESVTPEATLVKVDNYDDAVQMVIKDEVDALVADYPICVLSVLRNPNAGLAAAAPLSLEPIGIALPAGDPLLVNLVENYLVALRATGLLEVLRKRWFDDASWLAQVP